MDIPRCSARRCRREGALVFPSYASRGGSTGGKKGEDPVDLLPPGLSATFCPGSASFLGSCSCAVFLAFVSHLCRLFFHYCIRLVLATASQNPAEVEGAKDGRGHGGRQGQEEEVVQGKVP
jgi:hypothetical protein